MATDGIKIIDGDLAADIYGRFMEMYDAGASLPEIKEAIEQPFDEEDGFDYEIYITVYALALWQTGQLTSDVLQEVEKAIARGAGVKVWTEECDSKEGRKRQRELEKLWDKLKQPNPKVRKRRVYKPITKFIFDKGAVLVFQLPDGNYCATILAEIFQHQGRCEYLFTASTYKDKTKPSLANIRSGEILGRTLWSSEWSVGVDVIAASPKLLRSFAGEFEQIGVLKIKPEFTKIGSYRGAQDFESFCWVWADFDVYINTHQGKRLQLSELL